MRGANGLRQTKKEREKRERQGNTSRANKTQTESVSVAENHKKNSERKSERAGSGVCPTGLLGEIGMLWSGCH